MSNQSRRADAAEQRAARLLKTKRLGGSKKKQAVPDLAPLRLQDGRLIALEVKHRKTLPKLLTAAMAQARKYVPTADEAAVILHEKGSRNSLAIVNAEFFAQLIGRLEAHPDGQLNLALTMKEAA